MFETGSTRYRRRIRFNRKFLFLINEYLKVAGFIWVANEIDATIQFFVSFQHGLAFIVEQGRIDDRVTLAKIVAEIDVLIFEGLKSDLDLVSVLRKAKNGKQ
jgi:hypothetical protein